MELKHKWNEQQQQIIIAAKKTIGKKIIWDQSWYSSCGQNHVGKVKYPLLQGMGWCHSRFSRQRQFFWALLVYCLSSMLHLRFGGKTCVCRKNWDYSQLQSMIFYRISPICHRQRKGRPLSCGSGNPRMQRRKL